MTALPKATVKTFFEQGDRPTQAQFADLIDSYQDANSNLNILASASIGAFGTSMLATATTAQAQSILNVPTPGTVGAQIFATNTTAQAQDALGAGSVGIYIFQTQTTAQAQAVLSNNFTLQNPVLGAATATSINFGGTTLANFVEGSSTPTITNVTNVAAANWTLYYARIGNTVVFWGGGTIDPTSAALIEFRLSLPIASSFSVEANAGGIVSATNTNTTPFAVYADPTNDALFIRGIASTGTIFDAVISGSYRVI